MNRQPIDSSNLASVGYNRDSRTLEVEFKSGAIYQYFGVPQWVYVDLTESEVIKSKGEYFNWAVKKAGYKFRKVKNGRHTVSN